MPEKDDSTDNGTPDGTFRSRTAYFLMFCFVIFTSLGAGFIFMPAGLIVFGMTAGIFGYLLGAD